MITRKLYILLFFCYMALFAHAQEIGYASSRYKTSSGAIGPSGVIATHKFELHIESSKSIILGKMRLDSYEVEGRGLIVPPNLEGSLKFEVIVYIHQKQKVWYNAVLIFEGIKAPVDVTKLNTIVPSDPKVLLQLKTSDEEVMLKKKEFDAVSASYNK